MIGKQIANYEIKSLLGEGGMGSVYAAEHAILQRKAAIKLLRRELTEDRGLVQRFINEARVAAAIRHPNIIEVMDVGMTAEGLPYILMEFLAGESLGERIRKTRLSVSDAVEYVLQAADGLAAAHDKGVIHRDLKPENLFLVADPQRPGSHIVKVLDFGIAKLRDGWSDGVKTGTGSLIGTPPYMSPEQCRGLHDEIDARSDIYSLGTILFELLCGEPPFTAKGWGEVLLKHMTEAPPVPSRLHPGLPAYLDEVVLKMLAKDKAARYASMAEVQAALTSGGSTLSRELPVAELPAHRPRRSPTTRKPSPRVVPANDPHTTLAGASGAMEAVTDDSLDPSHFQETVRVGERKSRLGLLLGAGSAALVGLGVVAFLGRSGAPPPAPAAAAGGPRLPGAVTEKPVVPGPPEPQVVAGPAPHLQEPAVVEPPPVPVPPTEPVPAMDPVRVVETAGKGPGKGGKTGGGKLAARPVGTAQAAPGKTLAGDTTQAPADAVSKPVPVEVAPAASEPPAVTPPPAPPPPPAKKKNDKLW